MAKMKYDSYIKETTKKLNKELQTSYTDKQVFIALQYPLSTTGIIERFMDFYGQHIRYDNADNVFMMYAKEADSNRYKWHQVRFNNLKKLLRILIRDALISADIITDVNSLGLIEMDATSYSRNAVEFVSFYTDELELSRIVEQLKARVIRKQKLEAEAKGFR